MPAAYDTYDYPAYWQGRSYEHEAEMLAIKALISKIPKIKRLLEIGAGYGRLVSAYYYRAEKIVLSDPSAKLLKLAKKEVGHKKISFIHSNLANLPKKVKAKSVDLVVLVRVIHHLEDIDEAFKTINRLLNKNGHFILEFPNKRHIKATLQELIHGNLFFAFEIFPRDRRSKKSKKKKTLPFINYHPDEINEKLKKAGFEVVERRSVSNIRNPLIKRFVPYEVLVFWEDRLQRPLSYLNFGPSLFYLCRKKG